MARISHNPILYGHRDLWTAPEKRHFPDFQQLYLVTNRSIIPKVTENPAQVATYELTFNPTDGGLHICLLNGQSQEGLKKT